MTHILVFGDSITYGAWDAEGGWVQRLRKYLDQKVIESGYELYHIVHNLGIDGDTSSGVLKRFESELKMRLPDGKELIVVFDVGANDSIINNKTKNLWCTPEKYGRNLNKLIKLARKYTKKIVCIGPFPIDESRADPMPWLPGHSYKNQIIEKFYNKMKEVAEKEGVVFVSVSDIFSQNKGLLADGVHPTTEGHRKFFEVVKSFLEKNKLI